ncbi:lipopolysaccharide assembly protein LapB, partial [Halobellus sp. Atlit-31R]
MLLGIPFFFGLGWIAARVDINELVSESRSLPRGYFKGLNHLLNVQPDKAIDSFIEIVKLDPESADMHFALGNLFRRRGETERAIRVHQNLLARPDLPLEQKAHAQYELGMDYLKAGLLDRAEETFNLLVDTPFEVQARRALLEIYQREKEWRRAIDVAVGLQESGAGARQKEIAQFYCELAQDALVHLQPSDAMQLLDKALLADRSSVRATILIGDAQLAQGDTEAAIMTWRR